MFECSLTGSVSVHEVDIVAEGVAAVVHRHLLLMVMMMVLGEVLSVRSRRHRWWRGWHMVMPRGPRGYDIVGPVVGRSVHLEVAAAAVATRVQTVDDLFPFPLDKLVLVLLLRLLVMMLVLVLVLIAGGRLQRGKRTQRGRRGWQWRWRVVYTREHMDKRAREDGTWGTGHDE
uniref:(northern house mosquito) hypothetical protein n=1 Tax=Culex pipiens TaxID=7175 RepID=A0A8D8MIC2_CULPI